MRPIKFRAWSKVEQKMKYYDRDCSSPNMTLNGVLIDSYGSNVSYQYEIEQFTGLCDKNGKEIYEGDKYKDAEGIVSKVEWGLGEWSLFPIDKKAPIRSLYWRNICEKTQGEIIGNRHQNPELLKGES